MSYFEKLNGVTQIDPQSLIQLSLLFAEENKMNIMNTAELICNQLKQLMKENNAIIIFNEAVDSPFIKNSLSFAEKQEK